MEVATRVTELMNEGIAHHVALHFDAAVERYARVIDILPDYGLAWRLMGVLALQNGETAAARGLLERAIRIDAGDYAAYSALGSVNETDGRLDAAYDAYAASSAIEATSAGASGMARVALALGRTYEAISIAEGAAARGMSDAGLLRTLGTARLHRRDYAGAADAFETSLEIEPHADAYANLGAAYMHLHRIDAAIVACRDALARDPCHAEATNNLGIAHKAEGAFPAAVAAFERAVALGCEAAHANLGTTRLLLGDYAGGWPEYGWLSAERQANPLFTSLPMWNGGPAPGQRLLIWPEQGIGDTIQMIRFLRLVRPLVGSLTLACPPGTLDLFRTVDGVDSVIEARGFTAVDSFDLWLPTIRLPVVFDAALASLPQNPYLRPDPGRVKTYRSLIGAHEHLRVGLVWSGNPQFEWNDLRSCGLRELETLNELSGISWFALQQGEAREHKPSGGMQLIPINADVADFADTAAVISQLDLIITVDTSVAHLAGALGCPAFVLLCNRPDWRWQLTGDATPWYASLRLFRQNADGAWAPVLAEVSQALSRFAEDERLRTKTAPGDCAGDPAPHRNIARRLIRALNSPAHTEQAG